MRKKSDNNIADSEEMRKEWHMGYHLWECVPNRLLSEEGKRLVSDDPNLCQRTMERLELLQSADEDCVVDLSDASLGAALLSSCVSDNYNACVAELVSRYCLITEIPFFSVAKAIVLLNNNDELFYYAEGNPEFTVYVKVPWKAKLYTPIYNLTCEIEHGCPTNILSEQLDIIQQEAECDFFLGDESAENQTVSRNEIGLSLADVELQMSQCKPIQTFDLVPKARKQSKTSRKRTRQITTEDERLLFVIALCEKNVITQTEAAKMLEMSRGSLRNRINQLRQEQMAGENDEAENKYPMQ